MMDLYQRKKTDSPTQNQEIQSKKRGKIKEKSEEKFFTKKSLDIFFLIHVCHLEYQSRISNLFSFFQSDFKQKRLDLKWHKGHLYNRCFENSPILRYPLGSMYSNIRNTLRHRSPNVSWVSFELWQIFLVFSTKFHNIDVEQILFSLKAVNFDRYLSKFFESF